MHRRLKQFLYGSAFLVVVGSIVVGFYFAFLKPTPTCFDGIQNQNERGIDCGGLCIKACIPSDLKPLELVEEPHIIPVDDMHASLLARVLNPNIGYAAKNFTYTFSIYYGDDVPGPVFSGSSYLHAGEAKYIILPNVPISTGHASRAVVEFRNAEWAPADAFQKPRLRVAHAATQTDNTWTMIDGVAANDDTVVIPLIEAVGIFRDKLGMAAGVSQVEIKNLAPMGSRPFTIVHSLIPDFDVAQTQVFLYALKP